MGIRFLCPNGHKLNVKADLAGKRASCPECGAKLVIPQPPAAGAGTAAESSHPSAPPNGDLVSATGRRRAIWPSDRRHVSQVDRRRAA